MKITANNHELIITEAFSGVGFETESGEEFGICMRDGGFEFNYGGVWYRAKDGHIDPLGFDRKPTPAKNTIAPPEKREDK